MTDKQLDDLFKKRLEDHSSQVPDNMWSRITSDNKKRKRWLAFRSNLFFLLLFFPAGVCTYLLVNNNNRNLKNEINKTTLNQQPLHNSKKEDKQKIGKKLMPEKIDLSSNQKLLFSVLKENKLKSILKYDKKRRRLIQSETIVNLVEDNERADDKNLKMHDNTDSGNENRKNQLNIDKSLISKDSTVSKHSSDTTEEDKKENANENMAIELYVSPEWPFNDISSGNIGYNNLLKKSTQSLLSYNVGARFSISITKELSAKIGMQFDQINEKVIFYDSALSTNSTYNNHYKSISMPLLLMYKIPGQKIINTSFTSGILLNVHSSYKGAIPSANGQALQINNRNVYKRNTGISFYVSMTLSKKINEELSLFAEPYFSYPVKNMADKFQFFKQRINTMGISLGVKYDLSILPK